MALLAMGLPRKAASQVVVVGDDPALEMRMANSAGAVSLGMATGIMANDAVLPPRDRPSALLADLSPLLAALA